MPIGRDGSRFIAAFTYPDKSVPPADVRSAVRKLRIVWQGKGGLIGGFQSYITTLQGGTGKETRLSASARSFRATWARGLRTVQFTKQLWPSIGGRQPAAHEWTLKHLDAAYKKLPVGVRTKYGAKLDRLPKLPPIAAESGR